MRTARKKPPWTPTEQAIVAIKHCELGNRWTQIAAFLPLRSENDVKNIWHSTLRCKDTQKRSFLRTYALAVHDHAYDYATRKAMFDIAVRQCGPPPAQAMETISKVQIMIDHPELNGGGGGGGGGSAAAALHGYGGPHAMDAHLPSASSRDSHRSASLSGALGLGGGAGGGGGSDAALAQLSQLLAGKRGDELGGVPGLGLAASLAQGGGLGLAQIAQLQHLAQQQQQQAQAQAAAAQQLMMLQQAAAMDAGGEGEGEDEDDGGDGEGSRGGGGDRRLGTRGSHEGADAGDGGEARATSSAGGDGGDASDGAEGRRVRARMGEDAGGEDGAGGQQSPAHQPSKRQGPGSQQQQLQRLLLGGGGAGGGGGLGLGLGGPSAGMLAALGGDKGRTQTLSLGRGGTGGASGSLLGPLPGLDGLGPLDLGGPSPSDGPAGALRRMGEPNQLVDALTQLANAGGGGAGGGGAGAGGGGGVNSLLAALLYKMNGGGGGGGGAGLAGLGGGLLEQPPALQLAGAGRGERRWPGDGDLGAGAGGAELLGDAKGGDARSPMRVPPLTLSPIDASAGASASSEAAMDRDKVASALAALAAVADGTAAMGDHDDGDGAAAPSGAAAGDSRTSGDAAGAAGRQVKAEPGDEASRADAENTGGPADPSRQPSPSTAPGGGAASTPGATGPAAGGATTSGTTASGQRDASGGPCAAAASGGGQQAAASKPPRPASSSQHQPPHAHPQQPVLAEADSDEMGAVEALALAARMGGSGRGSPQLRRSVPGNTALGNGNGSAGAGGNNASPSLRRSMPGGPGPGLGGGGGGGRGGGRGMRPSASGGSGSGLLTGPVLDLHPQPRLGPVGKAAAQLGLTLGIGGAGGVGGGKAGILGRMQPPLDASGPLGGLGGGALGLHLGGAGAATGGGGGGGLGPGGAPLGSSLPGHLLDAVSILNVPHLLRQVVSLPSPTMAALLAAPAFSTDDEASVLLLVAAWQQANREGGAPPEGLRGVCGAVRVAALGGFYLSAVLPALITDPRPAGARGGAGAGASGGRWFEMRASELAFLTRWSGVGHTERMRMAEAAQGLYDTSLPWYDLTPRPPTVAGGGVVFNWTLPLALLLEAHASGSGQPHVLFAVPEGGGDAPEPSPAGGPGGGGVLVPCVVCRGLEWHVFLDVTGARTGGMVGIYLYCRLPDVVRPAGSGAAAAGAGVVPGGGVRLAVHGWRSGKVTEVFDWEFDDQTFLVPEAGVGCPTALALRAAPKAPAGGEALGVIAERWTEFLQGGAVHGTLTFPVR
ncbi:hypothetical protein HYH03_015379 [Edaphochlamys debaryana]|uniref:Uncharacterized protein n=1 Tax=Edaphochlamys debaryana TaxID=47281 RepID=A0A836BR88_9CHLO|nr:hypothetical protein HYH03_015379 [Edaphochlamys debaryana]|eukprot:KAG2485935.1 hypothetical protein HYH03_015379 [Edaphochlamys debaryana]